MWSRRDMQRRMAALPKHPLPTVGEFQDDRPRFPNLLPALAAASWLWAVLCLPSATNAAVGLDFCLLLPLGGIIGLTVAGVSLGLLWNGFGRVRRTRTVALWTLCLLAFAWTWLLLLTDVGLMARIALSERALLAAAEIIEPYGSTSDAGWIGLFRVSRIERNGEAIAFETAPVFMDSYGLLYLPPGSAAPTGWRVQEHLIGNWYRGFWQF